MIVEARLQRLRSNMKLPSTTILALPVHHVFLRLFAPLGSARPIVLRRKVLFGLEAGTAASQSARATATRSNSATLQACATQPRASYGSSPSKISDTCPSP